MRSWPGVEGREAPATAIAGHLQSLACKIYICDHNLYTLEDIQVEGMKTLEALIQGSDRPQKDCLKVAG